MADLTSQAVSDPPITGGILSDDDIVHILAPLRTFKSLLVAVSGGADSVALLRMIHRWRDLVPDPPVVEVATVDHGLRVESADETRWVADLARVLGLAHSSQQWTGEKPTTGLQAAARSARYRLLLEVIAERALSAPTAIVTAHTQDDQAETVVMRMARGSGIDGIGAMAATRALKGEGRPVMLVRPLLGVSKSRLIEFLKSKNQAWLEDPSNTSRAFERIRLRQARPHLETLGLSAEALARSAARARRARAALDHIATEFLGAHVAFNNGVMAELDVALFQSQPDELQIRILARLLSMFGGAAPQAQLTQIETVQACLGEVSTAHTVTLGGCLISKQLKQLQIYREAGRVALEALHIVPGKPAVWDQRFNVSTGIAKRDGAQPMQVRALEAASFAAIRAHLASEYAQLPAAAAQTVPSFWCEGQLVAVPTLNFYPDIPFQPEQDNAEPGATSRNRLRACTGSVDKALQTGHGVCNGSSKDVVQAVFVGLADHGFGT